MKTPVTIYGFGYVGKAVWRFLRDHYDVHIVDPGTPTRDGLDDGEHAVIHTMADETIPRGGFAVICAPTPMADDGTCDTSIVEGILRAGHHDHYLVKSTVLPGTCKRLAEETGKSVCHSPEFIGEGRYEIPWWKDMPHPTDMRKHSFHIFGGPREATKEWVSIWQRVAGWAATYQQTDSTTSELCKYMENSYLGTKKVFCDEFFEIAKALGVDYNELKELWLLDGRIGRSMTLIFPDARGFSGKCIPKDVNAIVKASEAAGYVPELLKEVLHTNKKVRNEKV